MTEQLGAGDPQELDPSGSHAVDPPWRQLFYDLLGLSVGGELAALRKERDDLQRRRQGGESGLDTRIAGYDDEIARATGRLEGNRRHAWRGVLAVAAILTVIAAIAGLVAFFVDEAWLRVVLGTTPIVAAIGTALARGAHARRAKLDGEPDRPGPSGVPARGGQTKRGRRLPVKKRRAKYR
jgi:hypothetical protein